MSRFKNNKQKSEERREIINNLSLITQLGILMTTTIFISIMIGIYLDKWLNTNVLFTLIFSFIGILAAFRNMYYQTMKKK